MKRAASVVTVVSAIALTPAIARANLIPELQTEAVSLTSPPHRPSFSTPPYQSAQADALESEPLNLEARISVTLDSGPGAGYGSTFSSFYAFVPFAQAPEENTWFGEGRLNLFAHDEVGGNVRIGYRQHDPSKDLVWGGYLGYDLRHTEFNETFHQLGLGAEVMGQRWEARLNGYLPVGDTRRQVAFADSGTLLSNLRFSGNNLLFDRFRKQTRTFEAAASGFDLEGGYRVFDWESGSLYAYLGTYYLNAPGEGGYLGARSRLLAELNDVFSVGVGVSTDGNFGTNFTLQFGATFGGRPARKQDETPAESVVARLGQPVRRQETIAIDQQQADSIDQVQGDVARNPVTGQPWQFFHVTDGATGGNGTFESPFGQVTNAIALAQSTGNEIVYVAAGDRSGMDGFAIPDKVQVLATGVPQFLDLAVTSTLGVEIFPAQQLPDSGIGTLPLLNGALGVFSAMVGMGNQSRLSGFDIRTTGNNQRGILVDTASNFTIDRNQISTLDFNSDGILVRAENGSVDNVRIFNNTIKTAGNNAVGIGMTSLNGGVLRNAIISGNVISTANAAGIYALSLGELISDITISGNTISSSGNGNHAIRVFANNGGTMLNATISGNLASVSGNNTRAIYVLSLSNSNLNNITISGNTVATSGPFSQSVAVTANINSAIKNVFIKDNLAQQAGQHSFRVAAVTNSNVCIAEFSGNTSLNIGVAGFGGNDLDLAIPDLTLNFVNFANIAATNNGFGSIAGTPSGQPGSCP